MTLGGSPPGANTFELSLIGCGVGECAVLHLGGGDWAIIDSCCSTRGSEPLALTYLNEINVDFAKAVRLVLLTHWHDDHVEGAAKVVEACSAAQVACSAAFAVDEFRAILSLYGLADRITDKKTSGVRELSVIQEIALRRIATADDTSHSITQTRADHRLYRQADRELVALAPSSGSIHVAHRELGELLQQLTASKHAIVTTAPDRNDYSVALWFKWGPLRAILGGDLEVNADPGRGWKAVLRCAQFPDGEAQIIKVAHHGSPNGDSDDVWAQLISKVEPTALLTAYGKGVKPRPAAEDIARLKRRTPAVYYTSLPSKAEIRRDRVVEKEINAIVRRRRVLARPVGQIRLRWTLGAERPVIEVHGTAKKAA